MKGKAIALRIQALIDDDENLIRKYSRLGDTYKGTVAKIEKSLDLKQKTLRYLEMNPEVNYRLGKFKKGLGFKLFRD